MALEVVGLDFQSLEQNHKIAVYSHVSRVPELVIYSASFIYKRLGRTGLREKTFSLRFPYLEYTRNEC